MEEKTDMKVAAVIEDVGFEVRRGLNDEYGAGSPVGILIRMSSVLSCQATELQSLLRPSTRIWIRLAATSASSSLRTK